LRTIIYYYVAKEHIKVFYAKVCHMPTHNSFKSLYQSRSMTQNFVPKFYDGQTCFLLTGLV